ncbi:MAG: hypothetical protein ACE5IK_09570 [Acidobacteriota bacterium]
MEVTRKQIALAFALVAAASIVSGASLAWYTVHWAHRHSPPVATRPAATGSSTSTQTRPVSSPQTRPSIMEPAREATIVGRAVCSSCSLGIGPPDEHHVYLVAENPYRVFEVLANAQLDELVAITGACAAGNYEVTATGEIRVSQGRNAIMLAAFSTRRLAPDPGA